MSDKDPNIAKLLNISGFWICQGTRKSWICVNLPLNNPEICLNRPETEPKIALQVRQHSQIHRGIQNAAKHLKWSRKERLAKKTTMAWNYFRKTLQFVWQGCKYRPTFEYFRVLNTPMVLNMSGFRTCQGLKYNEKRLVLDFLVIWYSF